MALQLLITLREVNPSVWRKIIVPDNYSFHQLHLTIQQCFGWKDCHLFQFSENDIMDELFIGIPDQEADRMDAIDARTKSIASIFQVIGDRYTYVYDFGDNWEHDILLEQLLSDKIDRPYCISGSGACPPEDVGGVSGYQRMKDIFETGDKKEKQSYREWLGNAPNENWNSDLCNITEINNRLFLMWPSIR